MSPSRACVPRVVLAGPLLLCIIAYLSCFSAVMAAEDSDKVKAADEVKDAAESRERRASSFVRIGRPSSFVRIGKDLGGEGGPMEADEADPQAYLPVQDPYAGELDKKASSFVRIGRGYNMPLHRFIRIGRMSDSDEGYVDEHYNRMFGNEQDFDKRESQFVRIGKKPSSFVRIGKADNLYDEDDKRASSFVRIGKSPADQLSSLQDAIKRASHFVRIGKGPANFVRIGRNPSSFVRIGRNPSSFVRIGKDEIPDNVGYPDKRTNSFVRIGKNLGYDLGSSLGYDDLGASDFNDQDLLKRASSFVRIGKSGSEEDKRASSFVRIGKSGLGPIDEESEKRAPSFVRIGKDGADDKSDDSGVSAADKRASSFVRIGKALSEPSDPSGPASLSSPLSSLPSSSSSSSSSSQENLKDGVLFEDDKPINVASRAHAFVRIGKIPSSAFVRIGKNSDVMVEPTQGRRMGYRRGSRDGQSSFVRIGK